MNAPEMLTMSSLKDQGWTQAMIEKLLPPPTLKPNPRYRSAPQMKLWKKSVVESVMQSDLYKAEREKADKRKAAAEKATVTKHAETKRIVEAFAASVQVERIDLHTLEYLALEAKDQWKIERGQYNFFAEYADDATRKRWMLNYIRHNLTQYDNTLTIMSGKVGTQSLYYDVKDIVMQKIFEVYPELADK